MGIIKAIKDMFSQNQKVSDNWNVIEDNSKIDRIIDDSSNKAQLLYKHSGRCSVCWFTKSELEESAETIRKKATMHFVDVIKSREVSDYIAQKLGVQHESPQAILVKNGDVVWHESHGAIKGENIRDVF